VYLVTRVAYMVLAIVDSAAQHWSLGRELGNWDGVWYLRVLNEGYPSHVSHARTPLGFFPLYPIVTWLTSHVLFCSYLVAGMVVSLVCGAVATVLVGRLAERWWGESASRRAVLFFCVFPGSVVFSMVYTEGLLVMLIAGCLLALEERRWLLAGVLAGLATAVGPVAVAIIPACAAAALVEIRRRGWHEPEARRALLAPLLAPAGLAAFGLYLWVHTGSPTASYTAQRYGWNESSTPFALYRVAKSFVKELFGPHSWAHPGINLNLPAGLLGAVFLVVALVWLWRERYRVPVASLVWTAGIAFLTVTSANTPPNPRMLLCAFPAVIVVAYRLRGRAFTILVATSSVLSLAWAWVSYVGFGLRP
jgi:hypothetical protein